MGNQPLRGVDQPCRHALRSPPLPFSHTRPHTKLPTRIFSLALSTAAMLSRSTTHHRAVPTKARAATARALRWVPRSWAPSATTRSHHTFRNQKKTAAVTAAVNAQRTGHEAGICTYTGFLQRGPQSEKVTLFFFSTLKYFLDKYPRPLPPQLFCRQPIYTA